MATSGAATQVRAFREEYRRLHVPARYRGALHLLFTFGIGSAAMIACLLQLQDVEPVEWLAVPLTALYVNVAEYWGHRGPMHRRRRGLGLVYERHTRQHHRFFTADTMPVDTLRDLRAVLFPPVLMVFFITAFALPAALLLAAFTSANVAWLFVATALAYFLNYEFLHLAYHLPSRYAVARWPLVGRLKRLHETHHDPRLMTTCNFNISYPLGDWLFGTLHRDPR
jgi:Fatty acid hydroxylase